MEKAKTRKRLFENHIFHSTISKILYNCFFLVLNLVFLHRMHIKITAQYFKNNKNFPVFLESINLDSSIAFFFGARKSNISLKPLGFNNRVYSFLTKKLDSFSVQIKYNFIYCAQCFFIMICNFLNKKFNVHLSNFSRTDENCFIIMLLK